MSKLDWSGRNEENKIYGWIQVCGGKKVIYKRHWVVDVAKVISHSKHSSWGYEGWLSQNEPAILSRAKAMSSGMDSPISGVYALLCVAHA
jgi:hypothetical protein